MTTHRNYQITDKICLQFDSFLRTVFGKPLTTGRPNPADALEEPVLSEKEIQQTTRLMRVNHTGEVCAQALYQGQSITAKSPDVREKLQQSAAEENDHLHWCKDRIEGLDSHTSYLNPFFYCSSFMLGIIAGLLGDRWSLGFLEETEHQVCKHLTTHLNRLPEGDYKSRLIVQQMRDDEAEHAITAQQAGAAKLPDFICQTMQVLSFVMTGITHWV